MSELKQKEQITYKHIWEIKSNIYTLLFENFVFEKIDNLEEIRLFLLKIINGFKKPVSIKNLSCMGLSKEKLSILIGQLKELKLIISINENTGVISLTERGNKAVKQNKLIKRTEVSSSGRHWISYPSQILPIQAILRFKNEDLIDSWDLQIDKEWEERLDDLFGLHNIKEKKNDLGQSNLLDTTGDSNISYTIEKTVFVRFYSVYDNLVEFVKVGGSNTIHSNDYHLSQEIVQHNENYAKVIEQLQELDVIEVIKKGFIKLLKKFVSDEKQYETELEISFSNKNRFWNLNFQDSSLIEDFKTLFEMTSINQSSREDFVSLWNRNILDKKVYFRLPVTKEIRKSIGLLNSSAIQFFINVPINIVLRNKKFAKILLEHHIEQQIRDESENINLEPLDRINNWCSEKWLEWKEKAEIGKYPQRTNDWFLKFKNKMIKEEKWLIVKWLRMEEDFK